jgi:fumarate hydratase subunit alpha
MLDKEVLVQSLAHALGKAATRLPSDVVDKLKDAYEKESQELARMQLGAILENVDLAANEGLPLCQDTGVQIFFIRAGYGFPYLNELHRAIPLAIERATQQVPLRPNTCDPFTGKNPKNNLGHNMPSINIELVEGDSATVHAFPKGGGSENMSALWMLTPAEGFKGMRKKILEHMKWAGGKPCPPVILGLGVGGGADIAVKLAKKALLRPLDKRNPDPKLARLEEEMLEDVNALGVGPMGLGGDTTALAVNLEYTMRHPATYPTAMVVQCWCDRRAVVNITSKGEIS